MKRTLVVVGGLVVIVVLLLALGRRRDAAREQEAVLPAVQGPTAIEAEGRGVPARGAAAAPRRPPPGHSRRGAGLGSGAPLPGARGRAPRRRPRAGARGGAQ